VRRTPPGPQRCRRGAHILFWGAPLSLLGLKKMWAPPPLGRENFSPQKFAGIKLNFKVRE